MDGPIAKLHKAAEFEGPLIAVLKDHIVAVCGDTLSMFTMEMYRKGDWGHFRMPDPFVGDLVDNRDATAFSVFHQRVF